MRSSAILETLFFGECPLIDKLRFKMLYGEMSEK